MFGFWGFSNKLAVIVFTKHDFVFNIVKRK